MNKIILSILLFIIANFTFSQVPVDCGGSVDIKWVQTIGGLEADQINDVVSNSDGEILITGYFSETVTFQHKEIASHGEKDFFLAKLDDLGNVIWIKTGGGVSNDFGKSIAIDEDGNIYVLGIYKGSANFNDDVTLISKNNSNDIFLLKYSHDGDFIWARSFGNDQDDMAGGLAIDYLNNPTFIGSFTGEIISFAGNNILNKGNKNDYDFFVAKYNSNGNPFKIISNASNQNDFGIDIAYSDLGEMYIMGEFSGSLFWGSPNLMPANGNKNIFIAKYIDFEIFDWVTQIGSGSENDKAGAITLDNAGYIYICNYNDVATNKASVNKFASDKTHITASSFDFGGTKNPIPTDIATDIFGNVYLTGNFNDIVNEDYFFVKYNSNGSLVYEFTEGSNNRNGGTSICLDKNDNIIVGGFFNNQIDLNSTTYISKGNSDLMVIKYEKYFTIGEMLSHSINCDPNNICIEVEVLGGVSPLSYLWSNGSTTKDICGITAGDYSITVTDNSGCSISKNVTVNPIIPPTIYLPNHSICPNNNVTLDPGSGFNSYTWSTGVNTQTITVSESGTYSVTVTDANSCTATASSIITVHPKVNLLTEDKIYICIGEYATLSVLGYNNYEWSNGSTESYITTNVEGIYWVKVFDGNCFQSDTVEIIAYPHVSVDLGEDNYFCEGDSIIVSAGSGFSSYLWNDNSIDEYIWVKTEGIVAVTVTDSNGCKADDEIHISKKDKPVIDLGEDGIYCTNNTITLSPTNETNDHTFLWNTGERSNTIDVENSGYYWVKVTNKDGCSSSDTIYVKLYPIPNVNLGEDVEYCEGDSVLIQLPNTYTSYLWSTGSTESSIYLSGSQKVSVTITDINGCSNSDTIIISERTIPHPYLGNDTTLCNGATYILSTKEIYYKYNWNTGSNQRHINISLPGTYSVTVSDDIGCSNSASINIRYDAGPKITNIKTDVASIIVTATEGTPPYTYSVGGEIWQEDNVFKNYPPDYYLVFVKDKNHCTTERIVYLEEAIRIPDFFTPNGDGYNDVWEIEGLFNYTNAEVSVFDRFGKLLYQFNSTGNWNGMYNGRPLPSDTYWYVIEFGNTTPPRKGSVTIKR
jgi:gliding motility-associated-like protein